MTKLIVGIFLLLAVVLQNTEAGSSEETGDVESNEKKDGRPARCLQPKVTGLCKAHMKNFYYDENSKTCIKFIYGGCGGNENKFATIDECKKVCQEGNETNSEDQPDEAAGRSIQDQQSSEQNIVDACLQPKVAGRCRAALRRFYYDAESKSCSNFLYGGCGGNDNRFNTQEECEARCIADATKKSEESDPCQVEKKTRQCQARISSFYWDRNAGVCKPFVYGGCGGNSNRFKSLKECQAKCDKSQQPSKEPERNDQPDLCFEPKKTGPCRAMQTRFYYDADSKSCQKFTYGGCKGNDNRFSTQQDCESTCSVGKHRPDESDPCRSDKDTGPCDANLPSFYWDKRAGACRSFVYGGCGGNSNRFRSIKECRAKCHRRKPSHRYEEPWIVNRLNCRLLPKPGPCRDWIRRYYFDSESRSCRTFKYGGCKGNKNRFTSLEDCESTCMDDDEYNGEYDGEYDDEYDDVRDHSIILIPRNRRGANRWNLFRRWSSQYNYPGYSSYLY